MRAFLSCRSLGAALQSPSTFLAPRSFSTSAVRDFARITLVGRLGAEPELTTTSSGRELVRYSIGTSYGPSDNRQTSWFRIASFQEGPSRDHLLGLPKGTLVVVEGDASVRVYDDADGRKTSALNIIQRSLDVLKRPFQGNDAPPPGA